MNRKELDNLVDHVEHEIAIGVLSEVFSPDDLEVICLALLEYRHKANHYMYDGHTSKDSIDFWRRENSRAEKAFLKVSGMRGKELV